MSYSDWRQLVSLFPDEKVIHEVSWVECYTEMAGKYGDGRLILTTRRIMHINYRTTGFWTTKFAGFDSVTFEISLDEVETFHLSEDTIGLKKRGGLYPGAHVDITLHFTGSNDSSSKQQADAFYEEISAAIIQAKTPKPIEVKQEIIQYNIVTKFDFGGKGVLKIACPHCGASSPLESKSSIVLCRYCGKQYIIPKKILDLI
jgi:hypothetical protein